MIDENQPTQQMLPFTEACTQEAYDTGDQWGFERAETGTMKFGDDWTGIFVRGDDALAAATDLARLHEWAAKMNCPVPLPTDLLALLESCSEDNKSTA